MPEAFFEKAERYIRSAKTAAIDPRFHQALLTSFSQRQLGDYSIGSNLSASDIGRMTQIVSA